MGKIRKCEGDVEVGRRGERNDNGKWMGPCPSTRCRPASHVNVVLQVWLFSGEFAFAKHAPPNVSLLADLD